MALTPETLPRHELNGLPVRVVESDDASRVGIEGRVVIETTNTLSIEVCVPPEAERWRDGDAVEQREDSESRVVMVPKSGSTFEFAITDDAADSAKESGTTSKLANTQPDSSNSDESDGAGEGVAYVTVDGSRLLSRPARRTETNGDSPWQ
ncbi:ribonuclease P protein component 1 [Natronobacterium gregoryi]|uniref:Ribonuclease P protein component 1 n=2 Tax=Natronobacterium gregoryi TaxID=44930 RepID=L0AES7_NATGS|nr:ribonuclease P protein component 1 [Natronobacterium gregoryi]AFZ71565.1 RNase P/RNase MRP subunit p29 [Natronobacterium gregoryi SP2]ELY66622.1 ribonuclease P protein component 1 [Natronobacterium gregoryi SP2]PLK21334.1 ribonuclease P [Natronobacterium gregoryi SP2]SFI81562.1 ribonuclease P protein subunit POP4 [Natronobacterium gregoryi]